MPLLPGKSRKTIQKNIAELTATKPSKARAKGIATLAKKRGISRKKAQQIQAEAIAFSKARKSRKNNRKNK